MIKKYFFSLFPLVGVYVSGNSMFPALKNHEVVLVMKLWMWPFLRGRDIIVFKDPRNGRLLIKRIKKIIPQKIFVEGDNKKGSTDSRTFGWIEKKAIVGRVIYPKR